MPLGKVVYEANMTVCRYHYYIISTRVQHTVTFIKKGLLVV